ncbi:hypothetical protein PIB30_096688 [Stylosanthes scabra]|uniref:Uncharacterized protein n=1 Tax=Stylosanthes scabra TaxID=79078 RepID=A0ABU6UUY6_9FABA|nr:hypothetical protein [Stylosanthes scabra]
MRRLTHYLHVGWMQRGRRELRIATNRVLIGALDQKLSRPEVGAKPLFNKKRKGKAVAESSNEAPRFKTPFYEAHFKGKLSARKVLPELAIDYNDEILSPCAMQIKMRKWEKLTSPLPAVGRNLVKEFYTNAWDPDKAKRKPYTYTTMVQGKDISFAPSNIKRVLRLRKD